MAQTERESKLQKRCIDIVRRHGGYVSKNAQSIYTEKGRADLTICVPTTLKQCIKVFGEDAEIGLYVAIELKRDGHLGEVSDAQKIVGKQIKKAKGMWFAIDDSDIVEALMLKFAGD